MTKNNNNNNKNNNVERNKVLPVYPVPNVFKLHIGGVNKRANVSSNFALFPHRTEVHLIAYSLLLRCVNSIFLSQFVIPFGAAARVPFSLVCGVVFI